MPENAKFAREAVTVIANDEVASDHYCITLDDPEMAAATMPGQFFQLRLLGPSAPFLPRPFSVYDYHLGENGDRIALKILYKVMGKGTAILSSLKPGDTIALTGPLGNTFSQPEPGRKVLIAAGGIGIAPFLTFVRECIQSGFPVEDIRLLYGARCASLLVEHERFSELGIAVEVITDDGSCGSKGNVVDLLRKHTDGRPPGDFFIYSSGPTPMLNALVTFCNSSGIESELSLEARMICGFGVCNSCVVQVKSDKAPDGWEYKLVCRDGAVFAASLLHVP